MMMDFKEGEVLCFDKPLGWTSFKVVGHVRYHLCRHLGVKKLKVGHAGTLDPLATGVMIVCTGKATKRIEEFQYHTKEYVATLRLGATTPSYDLEHEVDATYPTEHITRQLVEETLQKFTGEIWQTPPGLTWLSNLSRDGRFIATTQSAMSTSGDATGSSETMTEQFAVPPRISGP